MEAASLSGGTRMEAASLSGGTRMEAASVAYRTSETAFIKLEVICDCLFFFSTVQHFIALIKTEK